MLEENVLKFSKKFKILIKSIINSTKFNSNNLGISWKILIFLSFFRRDKMRKNKCQINNLGNVILNETENSEMIFRECRIKIHH